MEQLEAVAHNNIYILLPTPQSHFANHHAEESDPQVDTHQAMAVPPNRDQPRASRPCLQLRRHCLQAVLFSCLWPQGRVQHHLCLPLRVGWQPPPSAVCPQHLQRRRRHAIHFVCCPKDFSHPDRIGQRLAWTSAGTLWLTTPPQNSAAIPCRRATVQCTSSRTSQS